MLKFLRVAFGRMPRRDPFNEIEELIERMGREFEDLGGGIEAGMGGSGLNVDVAEDDETITVTADLPGYDRDDIEVSIQDQVLTLAAEQTDSHETETDEADVHYHRRERRSRSVSRRIRLPARVIEDDATATYKNGVLQVTLPKESASDADGHNIDIE